MPHTPVKIKNNTLKHILIIMAAFAVLIAAAYAVCMGLFSFYSASNEYFTMFVAASTCILILWLIIRKIISP